MDGTASVGNDRLRFHRGAFRDTGLPARGSSANGAWGLGKSVDILCLRVPGEGTHCVVNSTRGNIRRTAYVSRDDLVFRRTPPSNTLPTQACHWDSPLPGNPCHRSPHL